jgi:hypothetical protein
VVDHHIQRPRIVVEQPVGEQLVTGTDDAERDELQVQTVRQLLGTGSTQRGGDLAGRRDTRSPCGGDRPTW